MWEKYITSILFASLIKNTVTMMMCRNCYLRRQNCGRYTTVSHFYSFQWLWSENKKVLLVWWYWNSWSFIRRVKVNDEGYYHLICEYEQHWWVVKSVFCQKGWTFLVQHHALFFQVPDIWRKNYKCFHS